MNDDMVERVAKAIDLAGSRVLSGENSKQHQERIARAAIEAMREPTEAMRLAVEDDAGIQCGLDDCNQHDIPDKAWRLMIDAALAPPTD